MLINNLIYIKGENTVNIEEALKKWINIRFDEDKNDLIFKLYEININESVILTDTRLYNEDFFYLINYLYNSKKLKNKIRLEGYIIGNEENELKGKKTLIYISSTDSIYSVSAVSEDGINYRIDFDKKITQIDNDKKYQYPKIINLENPKIIKVMDVFFIKQQETQRDITARYILISSIIVLIFLLCLIIGVHNPSLFNNWISKFGIGLGIWFTIDYKMLRINKFYLISIIIWILYFGIILLIKKNDTNFIIDNGMIYPLTVLLFQKILRKVYLVLLNKEPKVDRIGSVSEIIYSMFLLIVPILLSFGIIELIN